ncbi:MAG: hypothetical protein QM765_46560 [Myxococcales bacterium]
MPSARPTPIPPDVVTRRTRELGLNELGRASIRQIKRIVDLVEEDTGVKFVRMEMGIPGLPAMQLGVDAQIAALREGVASIYPDIQGIEPVKKEIRGS